MSEETLQAVEVTETSAPAQEVKQGVEKGENTENQVKDVAQVDEGEQVPEPTVEELQTKLDKERKAFEKRIGRKTAATKALEDKAQKLEKELEAMRPKVQEDNAPKQKDYDSYDEYENAVIEHKAKERADNILLEAKEKERLEVLKKQELEVKRNFAARENEFRAVTPDYDEVSDELSEVVAGYQARGVDISNVIKPFFEFENAPAIAYELGKNPEILDDLISLTPTKVAVELYKISQGISTPSEIKHKTAPAPIKTVSKKSSGKKPLSKQSASDVMAWVNS